MRHTHNQRHHATYLLSLTLAIAVVKLGDCSDQCFSIMFSHTIKSISSTKKQILPGLAAVCLLGITLCLAPAASASTQLLVLTLNNSLSPSAARLLNGTSSGFTATAVAGPHSTNVTALTAELGLVEPGCRYY